MADSIYCKILLLQIIIECGAMCLRFPRLDGGTAQSRRLQIVDEYNSNDALFCFLISTRAGGLGLNLVCRFFLVFVANHVVVLPLLMCYRI